MQDVWRAGIQWDEKLPIALEKNWICWAKDLEEVAKIQIPRCYSPNIHVSNNIQLHLFADASEEAFAAVAYLRVVTLTQVDVTLVAAKTKVAPLKPLSIPRMELQAAVLASRLSCSIREHIEVNIQRIYFWTDSKCVLGWINADGRKYKQFVAHRIGEIQELTNSSDWRWVPSQENIADEATRSTSNEPYESLFTKWIHGPEFLRKSEEFWPVQKEKRLEENHDAELKAENEFVAVVIHREYNFLPAIERFSQWIRLIRSTSWLLRFCKILLCKVRKQVINFEKCLTVSEISEAEQHWIKYSQWQSFREDIILLQNNAPLERKSPLKQLNAALDENGLLFLNGRTNLTNCMSIETKKPFILSPKNEYTKLLLQHYHVKFRHQGIETILNEIRQKFWIIDGRAAVKSTFTRCLKCKHSKAKPSVPWMGQLPAVRLTPDIRAFVNVGMDYFGPLKVTVGRRTEKRWGVIFTCMAVRAIHLEIAPSLTTDSAIMAIRRMISRRGKPSTIYCDNGTNFRGAAEELKKALLELDRTTITDSMVSEGIDFKFLPAASPHMGGVWERLIGSIKRNIGVTLYDQSLKDETLETLFAEAENIVNSRPLTHVSVDPADSEALTPNHFLIGYGNQNGPPCNAEISKYSRKEWRKSQMLTDTFWKRWVREYLPKLTKRSKWIDDNKTIEIGDIVLIVDESAPRNTWKIGNVEKVIPGPDGRIRVADVKTKTSTYRRPVAELCRLIIDGEENEVFSRGGRNVMLAL